MALHLFSGISVSEFATSLAWYEKLLGAAPSMFPHETEAVWELAEYRLLYIVQRPEHAGHAVQTLMVDDLDATVADIARRGLSPDLRETYANRVRKVTYVDPDGNEIGYGEVPR